MTGKELVRTGRRAEILDVSESQHWAPPASHRNVEPTSLSELLENSIPYESLPVEVDERLRYCAFGGLASKTLLGLSLWKLGAMGRMTPFWVVVLFGTIVCLGIGIGVAIQTRGFTLAARAGHAGTFFTVVSGAVAAVPIVVAVAIGVAIAIAIIVAAILGIVVALGLLGILLSGGE